MKRKYRRKQNHTLKHTLNALAANKLLNVIIGYIPRMNIFRVKKKREKKTIKQQKTEQKDETNDDDGDEKKEEKEKKLPIDEKSECIDIHPHLNSSRHTHTHILYPFE